MKRITTAIQIVLTFVALSLFGVAQCVSPAREETNDVKNVIGIWVNVNNNSQGIRKIIISKSQHPMIQVFGACSPKACDWGTRQLKAYGYFSGPATLMEATYELGFATKTLNIILNDDNQGKRLIIDTFTHFTDGSGRKNYFSEATLKQVTIKPIPNKHTAVKPPPNTMRLTPEQIRAKRLAEWYKAHPDKNPNKKKVVIPKPQPKPQKSINQRLPKNCGFGSLYYGKVKYHQGNKAYYLTVKNRLSQNYSKDFQLTQFASPKLLNRHVVLYGGQLVGGRVLSDFNGAISGKVLQVVHNNQVDYKKLKVWCAKKEVRSTLDGKG